MAAVNRVAELQSQGFSDLQIIQQLQEEGVSPLEISQALEQAKIKSEVQQTEENPDAMNEGMQQSLMGQGQQQMEQQEQQEQQPEFAYANQYQPQPQQAQQQVYQPQYQEYQQYQPMNSETFTEIADQIAEEKLNNFKKSIGNLDELKVLLARKIENIDERLKKIEAVIEKIESGVLNRFGTLGSNVEEIKGEMKMMQDSFSKALNPLIDKEREKEEKHHDKDKDKKHHNMEAYLRR